MNLVKITVAIVTLFISGCASMLSDEYQSVEIRTEESTEIYVNNRYVGKGFAKVNLIRDEGHVVRVGKTGCQDAQLKTRASFNNTTLLGLFVDFGLISIPTDFLTGAAWEIEPRQIQLAAKCDS